MRTIRANGTWVCASLLAVALMLAPLAAGAQTWTGVLNGGNAIPRNESQATGSVTLMLSGTTLVVLMNWSDLYRFPGGVDLHYGVPSASQAKYAVVFPAFPAKQSGSYSVRIDLSVASAYDAAFLRQHGNRVDAAREAIVAALKAGDGYVDVRSQQITIPPEIGGRVELRARHK